MKSGALRRVVAVGCGVALAALVTGCALESAPLPPSLHIPMPVSNLTAARAGDAVTLAWTMPERTTDKVLLEGGQRVEICRLGNADPDSQSNDKKEAPCDEAGNVILQPGARGSFVDHLPAGLEAGAPRLLTYAVRVYGPYKRVAGYSNRATVVAGAAPPAVGAVVAQTRADGVVLKWQPRAPEPNMEMRMVRTLVEAKPQPKREKISSEKISMTGAGPAERQVLEVSLAQQDAGQALDKDAALDHVYQYVLQRVVRLRVDGATAELGGAKSAAVTVDAKDVFPPSVPQDLAAVADAEAGAIDLSWEPSPQADTAGYIVYRREAGGAWQRISGAKLVTAPAWTDKTAQPGVRYAYAVAAVDRDGNQSARSAPVEEELPGQP
ncbi:MAG: fibronectin type III domain-containing protein [Acidobacteriaceae bacterium]